MKLRCCYIFLAIQFTSLHDVNAKSKQLVDAVVDTSYQTSIKFREKKSSNKILIDRYHETIYQLEEGQQGTSTLLDLARKEGFSIGFIDTELSSQNLNSDVLFIHGLPHKILKTKEGAEYSLPVVSEAETKALVEWVSAGGGLFISLSHFPNGSGAKPILDAFGVNFRDGYAFSESQPSFLSKADRCSHYFEMTKENGLINSAHPIYSMGEKVENVHYLCGAIVFRNSEDVIIGLPKNTSNFNEDNLELDRSDVYAGMIGFPFGKGKVVVAADQGMFRDFVFTFNTKEKVYVTITAPTNDNDKLFVNMLRWLANDK